MLFGTFDILHAGHLALFKRARKYGEYVIAVIARDNRVKELKGHEPLHNERERKNMLSYISLVDEVVLGSKTDVYAVIKKYTPDVIVLGYDQEAYVEKLKDKIKEYGLNTKVVRLQAFHPELYKTTKIREYLTARV